MWPYTAVRITLCSGSRNCQDGCDGQTGHNEAALPDSEIAQDFWILGLVVGSFFSSFFFFSFFLVNQIRTTVSCAQGIISEAFEFISWVAVITIDVTLVLTAFPLTLNVFILWNLVLFWLRGNICFLLAVFTKKWQQGLQFRDRYLWPLPLNATGWHLSLNSFAVSEGMSDLQGKAVNLCSNLTLLWQYQVKLFSKFSDSIWFMMLLWVSGI